LATLILAPGVVAAQSSEPSINTGPAVGERIPEFEAVDQFGRRQTFETLRGTNGLLLLFHRSADW
jgi:hypothetical protein